MNSVDKLREYAKTCVFLPPQETATVCKIADEIEAECQNNYDAMCLEIERDYMLKSDVEMDKNAVQEYNLDVQVVAGQKIEYTTELRHRCGATTSMSVAFHLE